MPLHTIFDDLVFQSLWLVQNNSCLVHTIFDDLAFQSLWLASNNCLVQIVYFIYSQQINRTSLENL